MKKYLYYVLIFIIFLISSCNFEEKYVFNKDLENQVGMDVFIETKFDVNDSLDSHWAVKDGNLFWLLKRQKVDEKIENAIKVYYSRFVFCTQNTFVDLYGSPLERWPYYQQGEDFSLYEFKEWNGTYPVFDLINELNNSCGIRYIEQEYGWDEPFYYIHANNGKIYQFSDPAEQYLEYADILTVDGKIYDEKFPETASWENVVDYRICEDFIIALTSDGKVLTSGIDFSVENAVKIDIIYTHQKIPAVLTSEGTLVFGKIKEDYSNIYGTTLEALQKYYQGLQTTLTQAESFTDIVDFTYYDGNEFVILAQKADGSLIATTNNIYNPEYVSQPE